MDSLKEFFEKYDIDQTTSLDKKNFGSVYKGIDKITQKEWAVKNSETHPLFDKELFIERYKKAKELDHLNLLSYKESYRLGEGMYSNMAVMPLVEKGSLDNYWNLTSEDKKLILDQVLDGLYYLHAHEVVWQNLSARHILLEEELGNYTPKFINYGNTRKVALSFFSDYEYLAPEQFIETETIDLRLDIWSYGVLVYQLWTGRLPFGERSASLPNSKIQERILGNWELGLFDKIPEPYQSIAIKCLKRKKEERWNNCGEIIAAIKNWTGPQLVYTEKVEDQAVEKRFLRKPNKPIIWWQVVLLFILAALLGYLIGA